MDITVTKTFNPNVVIGLELHSPIIGSVECVVKKTPNGRYQSSYWCEGELESEDTSDYASPHEALKYGLQYLIEYYKPMGE